MKLLSSYPTSFTFKGRSVFEPVVRYFSLPMCPNKINILFFNLNAFTVRFLVCGWFYCA